MFDLIRMILFILPFLLCCFWGIRVNLSKEIRNRQVLMPVIVVLYCIVVFFLLHQLYEGVMWVIGVIPDGISRLNETAGEFVRNGLNRVNWAFWIFFILNPVILIVYYIIKKILLLIFAQAFKKNSGSVQELSGNFYEYDPETNIWGLKKKYGQMRIYYKVFFYSTISLLSILFIVSRWLMEWRLFAAPFYPAFGVLIIGELYFYLSGMTLGEYHNIIQGEDEEATAIVNYSLMRKYLRKLFGAHLVTENTLVNSSLEMAKTNDELIQNLLMSESAKEESFGRYIKALNDAGFPMEHSYIHSALEMLNGKSILFNNPFYNDLIPYISYPMNRTLLRHKKVMVIIGRHGIGADIHQWLKDGIAAVTNVPTMWRIEELTEEEQDLDIGIITRSNVHNIALHEVNREFFAKVEFVIIIEPSKLISTAQIGLNSLVKYCRSDKRKIVFSSCDKNCDGLVDSLSHLLMTSISEVSATNKHVGSTSYMGWDYDNTYWQHKILPNISRYLGIGTELSLAALKNQIRYTKWFGGEAYPVVDQLWINRQYYYDLLKESGYPVKQEELIERMLVTPNYWSAKVEKTNYMTVEDESNNLFEVIRAFSTRTTEQGFVNVISGEYLLKDYMADNAFIFASDPKAIPYIVADYARTERNVTFRLLLMLVTTGLTEEAIRKELSLMGAKIDDVIGELWRRILACYFLEEETKDNMQFDSTIIELQRRYNVNEGKYEKIYRITDKRFLEVAIFELQNAGYLAEDEKGETHYLGAELRSHIFQRHLPGQFFTFSGKYYEVRGISGDGHVLVRRAADHISGRPYYRQIRNYRIKRSIPSLEIGEQKNISGMLFSNENADIQVETHAYLDMITAKDFKKAKEVQINDVPIRNYHNKKALRIVLPNITDEVRKTITFMINEVFRTIFAENHTFIAAVTECPEAGAGYNEENGNFMTYSLQDESENRGSKSIYIIEDSQIDLGLLIAAERNFKRILEIICDFLDWHLEAVEKSKDPPQNVPVERVPKPPEAEEQTKKKGWIGRLIDRIKNWFKRTPDQEKDEDVDEQVDEEVGVEVEVDNEPANPVPENEAQVSEKRMILRKSSLRNEGEDTPEGIIIEAEEEEVMKPLVVSETARAPYHLRHFLLLGGEAEHAELALKSTKEYLISLGMEKNSLKQARDGKDIAAQIEASYNPLKPDAHFCDFCGVELVGTEYEVLKDGRERCMNCGRTAVKTKEEFTRIFKEVMRNMEAFYGIKFNCGIRVEMVNSRRLHKRLNRVFVPTNKSDPRILGVAIHDSSGFTILVENGSPRISSIMTIAHELVHIWQFVNWDRKAILAKYGQALELEIYEGMAKWVEIQYAILINEIAIAKREEMITIARDDEYGRGFILYLDRYPFSLGSYITKETPFLNRETPL